jgi:hypothetical protein
MIAQPVSRRMLTPDERKSLRTHLETIEAGWGVALGVLQAEKDVITAEQALADARHRVSHGKLTKLDVGKALLAIKDGDLFREEAATWDDFCKHVLKRSRSSAHQLIQAARRVADMPSTILEFVDADEADPTPTMRGASRPKIEVLSKVKPADAEMFAAEAKAAGYTSTADLDQLRRDLEKISGMDGRSEDEDDDDDDDEMPKPVVESPLLRLVRRHARIIGAAPWGEKHAEAMRHVNALIALAKSAPPAP